jgi:beta-galactosidase
MLDETRVFGSSPEALRQLEAMVTQHRNHPCIFMWSLGNEEYHRQIQSTDRAADMAKTAYELVKSLDNTRAITFGSNNGCTDRGVNSVVDVRGFNYIRNLERLTRDEKGNHIPGHNADRYHAEHPDKVMLGTEEGSHFLCRDAGFDNFKKGQVNATGEHTAMGGSTPEGWVKFYESRDYLVGGFMWTGIDYYGEPKPFTQINTSSSFGAIDLVGFPKNSYHYYRSCWLDEPILEILPHWDFKKGDLVRMNNAVFMNIFDPNLDKPIEPISKQTYKVTQCRFAADGSIEYKLRGCYGWWKERHLVEA